MTLPAAILDVDGTLVDSNYHHTIAWYRAFRDHGIVVPLRSVHRHIGMGGDQIVEALAGEDAEREHGDALREAEGEHYRALVEEVEVLPGARDLVQRLAEGGRSVVLASSAKEWEVEHYLDLLGVRDTVTAWTTSADVEATKPEPDLVLAALEKAGGGPAVMVGDSVWDCRAARNARVPILAVLDGGFGAEELREAGAEDVFDSTQQLLDRLDDTPLAG